MGPEHTGPSTYVLPEDEGQDGRREFRQEDDQDEQEELQREGGRPMSPEGGRGKGAGDRLPRHPSIGHTIDTMY